MGKPWENAAAEPIKPWERALNQANLATGVTQTPEQQARGGATSISGYLMQKAGVPKLGQLSNVLSEESKAPDNATVWQQLRSGKIAPNGAFDITGRGALGILGDWLAAKGLSTGLQKVGKFLHGTAYEVPEARYREIYGKEGPGPKQVAFEQRVDTPRDVMPAIEKAANERGKAYSNVTNLGGAVDVNRAFADAEKQAIEMVNHRDRTISAKGRAALDEIKRLKEDYGPKYSTQGTNEGLVPLPESGGLQSKQVEAIKAEPFVPASNLQDFSNLKTALQSQMGDAAWNDFLKTPEGQRLSGALGTGAKNEILQTAAEINPADAAKIAEQNKIMESLYAMAETAPGDILKEARKNKLITPVDAALFVANPMAELAKKSADILKIPTVRTKLGRGLYNAGRFGEALTTPWTYMRGTE